MKLLGHKIERLHAQLPAGAWLENFGRQASISRCIGDQLVAISNSGIFFAPSEPPHHNT